MEAWYTQEEPQDALIAQVSQIRSNQQARFQNNLDFLRMYSARKYNMTLSQLDGARRTTQALKRDYKGKEKIRINIIQSICDTITAKITKNRPRPLFLTKGGDFLMRQKAKKRGDFIEGIFLNNGFYERLSEVFLDCTIFDFGVLKILRQGNNIRFERIFPNEILVDEEESLHETPRDLYQVKFLHRSRLIEQFPEHEDILALGGTDSSQGDQEEMIQVYEAWHLPNEFQDNEDEEDKGGRHVICVDNGCLFSEEWNKKEFPFVFLRWNSGVVGFYGQSLAEQLSSVQEEINVLARKIQLNFHLLGVPWIMIPYGSKIIPSHIQNVPGTFIYYEGGSAPNVVTFATTNPEIFNHFDRLFELAYRISGINALSSQGQKPAGLNSGVALRTYHDIETERHVVVGQMFERACLDSARQVLHLAEEISQDNRLTVKVGKSKYIEIIDWDDIDLEEDQYKMQIFPISLLPSTPAGKLQTIQELINIGIIQGKEDILSLLDYPDLNSVQNEATAKNENIEWVISEILENGKDLQPEPYQDLALGIGKMQQAYLYGMTQNVSLDRLDKIRIWIETAKAMIAKAQAEEQEKSSQSQQSLAGEQELAPQQQQPNA